MIDIGIERKHSNGHEYVAVLVPTTRKNPLASQCHVQYVRRDKFHAATKAELLGRTSPKPNKEEAVVEDKGCKPKKRPGKKSSKAEL